MIVNPCTKCGHGKIDHQVLEPQCSAVRCTCLRYKPAVGAEPIPAVLSTPTVRRGPSAPAAPRPVAAVPPGPPPAPTTVLTVEDLVRACNRSEFKRTQALGPKLTELADKITAALRTEREAAEMKAKQAEAFTAKKAAVEKLAEQLAKAKAELRDLKPTGVTEAALEFACGHCGDLFQTSQGRGLHITRKHGRAVAS